MKFCLLLIIFSALLGCNHPIQNKAKLWYQDSVFSIYSDTIEANIDGYLTAAIKVKNNYYALFNDQGESEKLSESIPYILGSYRKISRLYIINNEKGVQEEIEVPEELWDNYDVKFSILRDSIILSSDGCQNSFFFDVKRKQLIKIKKIDIPIYEDAEYYVTDRCCGEFGGAIFFKNKINNNIYVGLAQCALIINRWNNNYILTNNLNHLGGSSRVYSIKNPSEMTLLDSSIMATINRSCQFSNPMKGMNMLMDTIWTTIPSTFVSKNNLYHFFNSYYLDITDSTFKSATGIATIKNKKLNEIIRFKPNIFLRLEQQNTNNKQFLTYRIEDSNDFGFMEVDSEKILMHYFVKK